MRALTELLARTLLARLRRIVGAEMSPASWHLIAQAMYPDIVSARRQAVELATQYYGTAAGHAPPRVDIRPYRVEALESALGDVLPDDGQPLELGALEQIIGVAHKHTEDAARRRTIAAVIEDDRVPTWARYDPDPPTCHFCLMLIGRGPVYHSAEDAGLGGIGKMNQWHRKCSCKAVLVRDRSNWLGRDQTIAAAKLYTEATEWAKREGERTPHVNNIRQYLRDVRPDFELPTVEHPAAA